MKASAISLLACVLLVPVLALAQEGQGNLNTITSVQVRGGTVEIVGTKKPNFTTFTMTDPPRLVIDISEAVFSGVKEDQAVGNGTISGIRTASYGSEESSIARVLIGYEREVETDIQATGNSLVVSVVGAGAPAVAAAQPPAPEAAPAQAEAPAGATAAQAAEEATAERERQEATAAQAAQAAAAEREQQERAAAQAAAQAKVDEEQRQAQARAEAERKQQAEAERVAAQRAQQERLAQERAAQEAQVAAERQRREDEARAVAEERERRRAEAQAAAEARRQQAEAQRQARASRPEPRPAPEQGERLAVSSRGKRMTLVGFKQEAGSSRVFVRTNEPVSYSVSEGERTVVLELENTRIDMTNNTRALDTSFFDTAVASVDADAGPARTVRVSIRLKEQVPFQTRQEGNEVSIEFQRPAR